MNSTIRTFKSAHSVRLSFSAKVSGEQVAIDFTAFSNGEVDGTASQNGTSAKVVIVGATLYVNADAAYWISSGASQSAAHELASRWVSGPATASYKGFTMSDLEAEFESHKDVYKRQV